MCTGYDKYGYDRTGYNKYGYDNKGYDKYGYSKDGECFVQFCSLSLQYCCCTAHMAELQFLCCGVGWGEDASKVFVLRRLTSGMGSILYSTPGCQPINLLVVLRTGVGT
jgi:hypothetical protein